MICIGHRGARGHVPENTLASILKAIELGATCIEIDVRYVDGHLMVFHDYRLERLTDGEGYIADKNFDYLRSLSLSNGEKIPTLEEIYDAVDQRVGINIELKGAGAAESIVNCIKQFRLQGWSDGLILVSSYNHRELARIRELDQNIKIGVLFECLPIDDAAMAETLGAYSVHPSIGLVDQRFVDDAHARNLKVYVYTVNEPDDIVKMKALAVDGVFTDFPERVLADITPTTTTSDTNIGWL